MDILSTITEFGVPVGAAVLCGWFIYIMYINQRDDNKEDKAMLYEVITKTTAANERADMANERVLATIEDVQEANREILAANKVLMAEIKHDICVIKEAVVK